jgi:hypothetical protein
MTLDLLHFGIRNFVLSVLAMTLGNLSKARLSASGRQAGFQYFFAKGLNLFVNLVSQTDL